MPSATTEECAARARDSDDDDTRESVGDEKTTFAGTSEPCRNVGEVRVCWQLWQ